MGNCLPCEREKEIDKRSARQSYFDAKTRERETMVYTCSKYKKENKLPFKLIFHAPPRKKQQ